MAASPSAPLTRGGCVQYNMSKYRPNIATLVERVDVIDMLSGEQVVQMLTIRLSSIGIAQSSRDTESSRAQR